MKVGKYQVRQFLIKDDDSEVFVVTENDDDMPTQSIQYVLKLIPFSKEQEQEISRNKQNKIKHDSIVPIIDQFLLGPDAKYAFVMEYQKGISLDRALEENHYLLKNSEKVMKIMLDIARGLSVVEENQQVDYPNFTPSKVIFTDQTMNSLKLLPFLFKTVLKTNKTTLSGDGRGAQFYSAPEMLKTNKPFSTARRHIWSLGLIFMELMIGKKKQMKAPFIQNDFPGGKLNQIKNEKIRQLVSQMLQQKPENRHDIKTVVKLLQELNKQTWKNIKSDNKRLSDRILVSQISYSPTFFPQSVQQFSPKDALIYQADFCDLFELKGLSLSQRQKLFSKLAKSYVTRKENARQLEKTSRQN